MESHQIQRPSILLILIKKVVLTKNMPVTDRFLDDFPKQMVTNVDTIVQRSIVDLGNNYQSYKLDVATPFECISCEGEASVTLRSRSMY